MIFGVLVILAVALIRESIESRNQLRDWDRIKQGAIESVRGTIAPVRGGD